MSWVLITMSCSCCYCCCGGGGGGGCGCGCVVVVGVAVVVVVVVLRIQAEQCMPHCNSVTPHNLIKMDTNCSPATTLKMTLVILDDVELLNTATCPQHLECITSVPPHYVYGNVWSV
jgi:hypothetical protein